MKKFVSVVLAVAFVFVLYAVSFAGPSSSLVVYVKSGTTTSVAAGSGAVATITANTGRVVGKIQNLSSDAIKLSLTATTTTTIAANGVIIAPYGTASEKDIYYCNRNAMVNTGAIYLMGVDSTTLSGNKAVVASFEQWLQ